MESESFISSPDSSCKASYNQARNKSGKCCVVQQRYVLAAMGFIGMMNMFCMRFSLSVVIVAMVNHSSYQNMTSSNMTSQPITCASHSDSNDTSKENMIPDGPFSWSPLDQGLLLGAYYYGYICSNVLGGYLAKRLGIRVVLGTQSFFSSLLTLISPTAARGGFYLFVTLRIMLGFLQGTSFPTMYSAWEKWAPPLERTFLTTVHMSGAIFGTIIIYPISGTMSQYFGWESVFYLTGSFSLIFSLTWLAIIHDSPQTHPRISHKERVYIVEAIGTTTAEKSAAIPWLPIMTSRATWAIYVPHFSSNWGMGVMFLLLPTYISKVLNFNLSQSGVIASIPFMLHWFCLLLSGWSTDYIRRKSILRTRTIRKINTVVGQVPPAIFLVLAGYVGCDAAAAVALFSLSVALNAFEISGAEANTYDVAPDFPQIVYGISNTMATTTGFIVPAISGLMLQDNFSIEQWRKSFWMAGCVYVTGALVYCCLATDKPQKWRESNSTEKS